MDTKLLIEYLDALKEHGIYHNSKIARPLPIMESLNTWKENLPITEHNVLTCLYSNDRNNRIGVTMGELAKRLSMRHNNLTPVIDRLIKKGLVQRLLMEDDRRVVLVAFSEKGYQLMKEDFDISAEYYIRNFSRFLSDEEIRKIVDFFKYYSSILEKFE